MAALLEQKFLPAHDADLSIKGEGGAGAAVLAGYASVFNGLDSYGDTVAPGAYKATISEWQRRPYRLPMKLEHAGPPIGIWLPQSLAEDAKGLRVEGELTPGHSVARDVEASVRHGAISGLSIGYRAKRSEMDRKTGVRTLFEIDLVEISAVTNPADLDARVEQVKTDLSTVRDFERFLRDAAGFTRREAETIAQDGFKAWIARESAAKAGDTPRDEAGGADVLAALMAVERQLLNGNP